MGFLIKRWFVKSFVLFLMFFYLAGISHAAVNGSISISGSGGTYTVTDNGGSVIVPDNLASPTNYLFFNSSPDPDEEVSGFAPSAYSEYDADGGFHVYRYDFSGTGRVYVLVLSSDNTHYTTITTGYYYTGDWNSSTLTLSGSEAKDYFINGQTIYEKATPYAPSIGVEESQVRVGETEETLTTLSISVTADTGSSPNIREVDGHADGSYVAVIVRDGDEDSVVTIDNLAGGDVEITGPSMINQNSGTFTLNGAYLEAGETYEITVWNRNWFTDDASANWTTTSWTLLGADAFAGTEVFTFEVASLVDDGTGAGINFFSMPFASPWYAYVVGGAPIGELVTAKELVIYLNTAAATGGNVVSSFCYWDADSQEIEKVIIDSDSPVLYGLDPIVDDFLENTDLEQGLGYQIYVSEDVSLEIRSSDD